ncbi:serine/threonine protein phosphatase 2A regulatory subunit B''beta-like [Rosa chinensis]|uniref:serine/threonine protein phosphatase 2A regulatory subunit B''beta-like n=1 Tax=Rosa chinensis TaxID=74649 RepID=UPI001AD93449|nr:serine/threonine protein phosphatase 2A regulatory subunit B''beta-like [Rosa chinensis]
MVRQLLTDRSDRRFCLQVSLSIASFRLRLVSLRRSHPPSLPSNRTVADHRRALQVLLRRPPQNLAVYVTHLEAPKRSSFGSGSSVVRVSEFYFQNGRPPPNGLNKQRLSRIDELFSSHMNGLQMQEFKTVTKEVCKLPTFLSSSLFREIDTGCSGIVARSSL